jgi:hypothetical protein
MASPFSDISTIKVCWKPNTNTEIRLVNDVSAIVYPITYKGQSLPSAPTHSNLNSWQVVAPDNKGELTGTVDFSCVLVTGLNYGDKYVLGISETNPAGMGGFTTTANPAHPDTSYICGVQPFQPKIMNAINENSYARLPITSSRPLGSLDLSWIDPSLAAIEYCLPPNPPCPEPLWRPTDMSYREFRIYYQKIGQGDNIIAGDISFDSSWNRDDTLAQLPKTINNPDGFTGNSEGTYDICGRYIFRLSVAANFQESSYNDTAYNVPDISWSTFFVGTPGEPTNIILNTVDASTINVTWDLPSDTGGGPSVKIIDSSVNYKDYDEPSSYINVPHSSFGDTITTLDVAGLEYGNAYFFKVKVFNDFSFNYDICDISVVCGIPPLALSAFKPDFSGITGQPGVENWMFYAKQGGKIVWNSAIPEQEHNMGGKWNGGIDISWVNPIHDNWVTGWSDTDMSFNSYVLYRSKEALEDDPVVEMVSTWTDTMGHYNNEISFNKFDLSASIYASRFGTPVTLDRLGEPGHTYRFSLVPASNYIRAPRTRTFDIKLGKHESAGLFTTYPNLFRLPQTVFNYESHYPNYPTDFSNIWYRNKIENALPTITKGPIPKGYYCNLWNQRTDINSQTASLPQGYAQVDFSFVMQNMGYPWGTIRGDGHRDFSTNPVLANAYKTSYTNAAQDGFLTSTTTEQSCDIAWNVGIGSGSDISLSACRGEIPWLLVNYEIGSVDPTYNLLEDTNMWIDISYTDSDGVSYLFDDVFATGYKGSTDNYLDPSGKYQQGNYMGYMDICNNADLSNSYKNEPRFSRTMNLYVHGSTYDLCDNLIPEDQPGGITGYKPHIDSHNKKSSAVQFNQGVFALQPLCMTPTYTNFGLESGVLNKQLYRLCDNSNYQLRYGIRGDPGPAAETHKSYSNWLTPPKTPYAKVNFPCWVVNPEHIDISGYAYVNSSSFGVAPGGTTSRHGASTPGSLWNNTWCGYYFGYNFAPPADITNHGFYGQFIWDVSWTISVCLKNTNVGPISGVSPSYYPIHVYQGFTRPQKSIDYTLYKEDELNPGGPWTEWGKTDLLNNWEYFPPLGTQCGTCGVTQGGGNYQFLDNSLNHFAYPNNFGDSEIGNTSIRPPICGQGTKLCNGKDLPWMQQMSCGGTPTNSAKPGYWIQPSKFMQLFNRGGHYGAQQGDARQSRFSPVPSGQVCNWRVATEPTDAPNYSQDIKPWLPRPAPTMSPWPWPGDPSNETYIIQDICNGLIPASLQTYVAGPNTPTNFMFLDVETTATRFQGASPAWEPNYFVRVDMQFKTCAQRLMECYDTYGTQHTGYWGKTATQCFEVTEGAGVPDPYNTTFIGKIDPMDQFVTEAKLT